MYPTIEVRWFQPGQIPPEIVAWFGQLGPLPKEQPARVDQYLRLPDSDSLGIKLREGRLELKQRERQLGVVNFHPRVSGLVEQWHKWGFPLTQDVSIPKPDAGWIAVKKQRRLRCYRVTADRQVKVMSAQAEPTQGCELELSRIEAAGQRWWSICFEAFGAEANLEEYLRRPVQHVLGLAEPPRLEKEHSFGYPHWLKTVAG